MSNNKQSSVEWLRSLYENRPSFEQSFEQFILPDEWEQAKAMHKEESINLTKHWYNQWEQGKGMTISEYYDQEFNNK